MTPTADKIYQSLKELLKQKGSIQSRQKQLDQELDAARKELHKHEGSTLLNLASPMTPALSGFKLVNDMRDISKLKETIKNKEKEKKATAQQFSDVLKKIDHYSFWMQYADTPDEARQKEAEKAIFG